MPNCLVVKLTLKFEYGHPWSLRISHDKLVNGDHFGHKSRLYKSQFVFCCHFKGILSSCKTSQRTYLFSPPLCWCGFKRCSKRELPHWTQRILFCNKDFFKQLFNLSSSTVEEFYYMRASNWDFGHMVKCDIYSAYYTTAFQEEQQIFWVKRIIFPCVWKKINRVHESAIKHMV